MVPLVDMLELPEPLVVVQAFRSVSSRPHIHSRDIDMVHLPNDLFKKSLGGGQVRLAKRQIPTQAHDLQDFVSGVCGSHVDDASSAAKC
jgi:hypothetical protein